MKNKAKMIFSWMFAVFLVQMMLFCGEGFAGVNYRPLTPEERIKANETKVQENPSLRNRWNPKGWEPASVTSVATNNLALEVISNLNRDETLSKTPVFLKVSVKQGMVTLAGVVNDENERTLIQEKVSQMSGVTKVENRLKIKTSNRDLLR